MEIDSTESTNEQVATRSTSTLPFSSFFSLPSHTPEDYLQRFAAYLPRNYAQENVGDAMDAKSHARAHATRAEYAGNETVSNNNETVSNDTILTNVYFNVSLRAALVDCVQQCILLLLFHLFLLFCCSCG